MQNELATSSEATTKAININRWIIIAGIIIIVALHFIRLIVSCNCMHNRPIAKLIKWFVKREKGKLVDARIRNTTTFCLS